MKNHLKIALCISLLIGQTSFVAIANPTSGEEPTPSAKTSHKGKEPAKASAKAKETPKKYAVKQKDFATAKGTTVKMTPAGGLAAKLINALKASKSPLLTEGNGAQEKDWIIGFLFSIKKTKAWIKVSPKCPYELSEATRLNIAKDLERFCIANLGLTKAEIDNASVSGY